MRVVNVVAVDVARPVIEAVAAGSVAGVTVGVLVALNLPKDTLRQVIGCIILFSGFFVVVLVKPGGGSLGSLHADRIV